MIYLNVQMPPRHANPEEGSSAPDPMTQILQMLIADQEVDRAERQANLATLQQIAQMAHNNNNNN